MYFGYHGERRSEGSCNQGNENIFSINKRKTSKNVYNVWCWILFLSHVSSSSKKQRGRNFRFSRRPHRRRVSFVFVPFSFQIPPLPRPLVGVPWKLRERNWIGDFETNNRCPKPTCLFIIHEIYYLVYSALGKLQTERETLEKVMRGLKRMCVRRPSGNI